MRKMSTMGAIAAAAAITCGAATVHADTYTVNSTVDAVDAAPGNLLCATAGGVCTLRAAVQEANAHPGPDVIELPAGTFALTLVGPGEDLSATGDLDVAEQLDVEGAGPDATVVDGLFSDRIFHAGATLTLRDLALRHGAAVGIAVGGALFQLNPAATTTVERVRFDGNLAGTAGGAIVTAGALTVSDSVFDSNAVLAAGTSGGGGAIGVSGLTAVTITNTEFTGNAVFGGKGGGAIIMLAPGPGGSLSVANSTFSNNATLRDGASPPNAGSGGAIYGDLMGSAFSVADSTFDGNASAAIGGAMIVQTTGTVTATNVHVTNSFAQTIGGAGLLGATAQVSGGEYSDNVAITGPAGGLYLGGSTSATVQNVAFRRNSGGVGPGGGLVVLGAAIAVSDVEATENSAGLAGGLLLQGTGALTITRARALNNGAANGPAGGLLAMAPSIALSDSTVDGNIAPGVGGGVLLNGNDVAVSGSTLSNNRAAGAGGIGGGGVFTAVNPSTIVNSTISGNVAEMQGGGLVTSGSFTIRNVTFAGNDAPLGSAISNGGTVNLTSSIVAGSAASHCAGAAITSLGFNIDSTTTCGLAGPSDQSNTDPMLGPLQDNGGPTFTHLAGAGSPALDKGNPSGCPATDQRGQTRPTDGDGDATATCDVGATEFLDLCPNDPNKVEPGICGCGVPDTDAALANGVADCFVNGEFKARLAHGKELIGALTGDASDDASAAELMALADGLDDYMTAHPDLQLTSTKPKPAKLVKRIQKAVKKAVKAKAGKKLDKAKLRANKAFDALDQIVAPQA